MNIGKGYMGNCKHNEVIGNIFTGLYCKKCGSINQHVANSIYPDKWIMDDKVALLNSCHFEI